MLQCKHTNIKKEDDQWVVPHNILLAVYSPSSVNVLCFDPSHGTDQARGYAAKYPDVICRVCAAYVKCIQLLTTTGYCSKPERYFFVEGEKNGVKSWSMFCFCPHAPLPSPTRAT